MQLGEVLWNSGQTQLHAGLVCPVRRHQALPVVTRKKEVDGREREPTRRTEPLNLALERPLRDGVAPRTSFRPSVNPPLRRASDAGQLHPHQEIALLVMLGLGVDDDAGILVPRPAANLVKYVHHRFWWKPSCGQRIADERTSSSQPVPGLISGHLKAGVPCLLESELIAFTQQVDCLECSFGPGPDVFAFAPVCFSCRPLPMDFVGYLIERGLFGVCENRPAKSKVSRLSKGPPRLGRRLSGAQLLIEGILPNEMHASEAWRRWGLDEMAARNQDLRRTVLGSTESGAFAFAGSGDLSPVCAGFPARLLSFSNIYLTNKIANGLRSGPIHTYLPLAQAKPNFKLELNTKVIRAIRNNSTITGVEVENAQGRQIINLKAGGAVILAAGVMSTPRVLFNSGIGPTAQINTVKSGTTGITLPEESAWINLPVGLDVKDHSRYEITFNVTGGLTTYSSAQLANPTEEDKALFNAGSGSHVNSQSNDTARFMMLMSHGLTSRGDLAINAAGNTLITKAPWTNTDTDREAWSIAINELFDLSRQPNSPISFSGGKNATAQVVLDTPVQSGIHMEGSAKMGTDDGREGGSAVVDLNTKFYGTDNLFVVDASFHPDLSTGNTQAIVMVAAEHAVKKIITLREGGSSGCRRRPRVVRN
ncbi:cellobiose dehydrogenase [Verticillium dahliae VdLs.17]|uniref:Cellobiose dehydrogenase n=1 Tax=Verticillium dahliae (strain VdLs.17 / ATCC MYA-4575 / FGSC 10137) TaxID=498257 RepID=G2WZQ9_VERDV|nr:cellobiose dehydrogenase [Verticillium dahliae VdLs.17]EGY22061.1 cellobiose dehydrogenase [Verticillium dahliae VdLs.17]